MKGIFRWDHSWNKSNSSNLKDGEIYEIAERDESGREVSVFINKNNVSDSYYWTAFQWLCERYGTIVKCINDKGTNNRLIIGDLYFVYDENVDTFSVKKDCYSCGEYSKERFIIVDEKFSAYVPPNTWLK